MDDAHNVNSSSPGSQWTREQARQIRRRPENVAPVAEPSGADPFPELHIWDTWLLRDRDGKIADVNGQQVAFSLTADAALLPGTRHDVAEIRCFHSTDGEHWCDAGPVFDDGALGQRQWAGSALYDAGELYLYYTAAGHDDDEELTYTQRIAVAYGGTLATDADGIDLTGPWTHETLLEPDGEWYETEAQSRGMTYTFRDPWFFEDPATGEMHLLFEANTPTLKRDGDNSETNKRRAFNGCVGVATSSSDDPLSWELQPPLLTAVEVNQELERPHIVTVDDNYYLFFCSHVHTFAPGVTGPDGLYGFVADAFEGPYSPLNKTGLVATNPEETPFQAYSWMAFKYNEEVLLQSFLNYYDFTGTSLDTVAEFPEHEQRARFGGTLAPTLRLRIDGDETQLIGALDPWQIPTLNEHLPPADGSPLSDSNFTETIREGGVHNEYRIDSLSGSEYDEPLS